MTTHTTLHINCQPDQKKVWIDSAHVAGMSFEDWVCNNLDAATVDTNPSWTDGLSERARLCLLAAGFNSRDNVLAAIEQGFDIAGISNAGNRVKNEVLTWLQI